MGFAKKFTSWSFSRFRDWRQCAFRAKCKHIDKLAEPGTPAMQRGAAIANQSEKFLKGEIKKMPAELKSLAPRFEFLQKQKDKFVEEMWGFTAQWQPVAWNDWDRCWLRVKIDVGYLNKRTKELHIDDGKSGKFRPDDNAEYMEQLDLYAAAGVSQYPTVQTVKTQLLYTDHGITFPQEGPVVYTRAKALKAQKEWDKRVKPMFAETRFTPTPGYYCRWCPYSKSAKGPCKY